jgi:hypothetical protein
MDPVLKLWLYQHWIGDQRDQAELAKNHAYLIGSFTNPEAVKTLMDSNTHESSDEDFEESQKMVLDSMKDFQNIIPAPQKRRRKATLVPIQG